MKKIFRLVNACIAIICVVALLVSQSSITVASEKIEKTTGFIDEAEEFLEKAVIPFGDSYEVNKYPLSQIYLGTEIAAYKIGDGKIKIEKTASKFFPIMVDDTVVGILQSAELDGGEYSFAYSEALAEDIVKAKGRIAIVLEDGRAKVIEEDDKEVGSDMIFVFPQRTKIAMQLSANTNQTQQIERAYPDSYALSVERKEQISDGSCWAACVSSVVEYITGDNLPVFRVMVHAGNLYFASMAVTKAELEYFGVSTSSIMTYLGSANLINRIYNNDPIVGGFLYSYDAAGHMMVIRGYNSGSSYLNMLLMDPDSGSYISVSVLSDSNMSFNYNGVTWWLQEYVVAYG